MIPDQLDILLHEGEGTMLEYKESLSASFARELVAWMDMGATKEFRSGFSVSTRE